MACNFIKEIEALGHSEIVVAVNLSAVQILRSDFVLDAVNIIKETGVNPNFLFFYVIE